MWGYVTAQNPPKPFCMQPIAYVKGLFINLCMNSESKVIIV